MISSTIGDHVELQRGTTYKSALLDQPGPVLLGLGSIGRDGGFRFDKLRTYGGPSPEKLLVYPGDLYVSLKDVTQSGDLLGAIARVPDNVVVGRLTQDTVKLCFKTDISSNYFYWLLRTPQYRQHCRSHATGTTNLGLSRDDFFAFQIPELTSSREKITNLLEGIERITVLKRQINQTLEEIAQAIFKSWFVDFDPVKAKIEAKKNGQDPERAAMRAISGKTDEQIDAWLATATREQIQQLTATAALFPDRFQDSELGEIPEGWGVSSVESLSLKVGMGPFGSNIKVSTFVEQGIPVISGQHLNGTMLEDKTFNFVTIEHAARLASSNVGRGDIVFTHAGNIGQVSYIPDRSRYERYVLSQRQFFLRCDLAKISPLFMTYFFRSPLGQHKLLANASQVGVPSIARPVSYLKSINLVVPSEALSDKFDVTIRRLHHRISKAREEITTLGEIRDILLPRLLSGELSVSEAGRTTEEAVA